MSYGLTSKSSDGFEVYYIVSKSAYLHSKYPRYGGRVELWDFKAHCLDEERHKGSTFAFVE